MNDIVREMDDECTYHTFGRRYNGKEVVDSRYELI